MKFLPIVERELREGARRRGTYRLRVRTAFLALLIGLAAYFINLLNPRLQLGMVLFWGLSGVSLLFCLLAGRRSTADCLSLEKREGTLGLLFLTDLKGYDVVLGKLAATSIAGFYALMGVLPVLAIPLLAGGMTRGEFWRMALALVNAFFLSLAIGIFASAVSRQHKAAMAVNFLLALLLAFAPAVCGLGLLSAPASRFVPWLFYSCPVFSFVSAGDFARPALARDFWWSLGVTHGLAWMLTLLACWIVPRTWGDKPPPARSRRWRWRELGRMANFGSPAKCAAFRQQALEANAFYWLAGRARLKPAQVWIFAGLAVVWWVYEWLKYGAYMLTSETCVFAALVVNSTLKLWIAMEAGQRLGEDRRSGAFELLLATPLRVDDFLRGQLLALRRQFFKPLQVVTGLELVLVLALKRHPSFSAQDMLTCLAGLCLLWADSAALAWVGMQAALVCKNQTKAASFTVARILILPWAAFAIVIAGVGILDLLDYHWRPKDWVAPCLWFGFGLAADLCFGLRARLMLRKNFRQLAAQSFLPEPPRSSWWNFCRTAAKWMGGLAARCVPARARKEVIACLAVGVALAAVFVARLSRPHFPPPVIVSLTQSNAPFRVFPGGSSGVFFIMPDGTLWQWGKPGAPQSPRSVVPEQVGVAHDWVKVAGAGTHCLGLRADGTIWGWGFSNGRTCPEPQPAAPGHDWIDLGTGQHHASAVKRDGTLWTWYEPLVANNGRARPRMGGPPGRAIAPAPGIFSSNWVAVCCGNESTLALRKDGTLWAGGLITGFNTSGNWVSVQHPFPTLLCADTNWTALDAGGLARNRAGELWDVANALPNPQAGAATVFSLVSINGESDCVCSGPSWKRVRIRANGTLWLARRHPSSAPAFAKDDWRQLGARSDWVAVWGQDETAFGMTSDGTVWTWGKELDKEPVKTYESRLDLLRDRLTGRATPAASKVSAIYSAQPRPLLKLIGAKESRRRK
jgi:ABC-type transport system involved in multi-copper enzyme maturation permease subunit